MDCTVEVMTKMIQGGFSENDICDFFSNEDADLVGSVFVQAKERIKNES